MQETQVYEKGIRGFKKRQLYKVKKSVKFVIMLLLPLMGVACFIFPDPVYNMLPYLLGTAMIAVGAAELYKGRNEPDLRSLQDSMFTWGILLILLGAVILVKAPDADGLIGSVWGCFGLLKGAEEIELGIHELRHGGPWYISILMAALEIVVSLALLMDPANNVHHHIVILGVELIVAGIQIRHEMS